MAIVKLWHSGFTYRTKANENERRTATRGELLDLDLVNPDDVARGERVGAWVPEETDGVDTAAGQTPVEDAAPFDQGVEALADWIRTHKPNGPQTVALAGGDPVKARLLLDAEAAANGAPRSNVTAPLAAILGADATNGPDDPNAGTGAAGDGEPATGEGGAGLAGPQGTLPG